ncbi:MAG: hypothetical protein AAF433_16435 [Bacteroidota bacterium]
MQNFFLLISLSFLLACQPENETPFEAEHNGNVFVSGHFDIEGTSIPYAQELGPLVEAYDPSTFGFTRDGRASLVAYLGSANNAPSQEGENCFNISPLEENTRNWMGEPYLSADLTVIEFVGLTGADADCRFDRSVVEEQLQLGRYALGQDPGQVHLHLYGTKLNALQFSNDFYLADSQVNDGLFIEITELDYLTADYTGIKGVYVSFEIPLAYGTNFSDQNLYELKDFSGRMFFPFSQE